MGKNDLTKEIENKIVELKENKNSVNKIIDNIFNEFNYKLTKYKVNKVISNHNTLQSEEETDENITEKTSNNNDENINHEEETNEEDEETNNETEEEEETKNNNINLKNNSLINSLNNSKNDIKINNIPQTQPLPINNNIFNHENKNDYIHDIINNTSNNNY